MAFDHLWHTDFHIYGRRCGGGGVHMHMRMNINIAHVLSTTFTTKLLLSEEGQEGTHHALKRYV